MAIVIIIKEGMDMALCLNNFFPNELEEMKRQPKKKKTIERRSVKHSKKKFY